MNQILKVKLAQVESLFRRIDTVDQCRIYIFKYFIGFFKDIHIHDLICDIILTKKSDRTGLHTQIHIFGHQNRLHFRIFRRQIFSCRENQMIRFPDRERLPYFSSRHIAGHYKQTSQSFSQFHPFGEKFVACQHIQFTYKLTSIEINLLVSLLKLIQFFEYDKREIDIIFLKVLQAIVVVKNNICVQHKIFLSSHDFLDLNVDICTLIHQSRI